MSKRKNQVGTWREHVLWENRVSVLIRGSVGSPFLCTREHGEGLLHLMTDMPGASEATRQLHGRFPRKQQQLLWPGVSWMNASRATFQNLHDVDLALAHGLSRACSTEIWRRDLMEEQRAVKTLAFLWPCPLPTSLRGNSGLENECLRAVPCSSLLPRSMTASHTAPFTAACVRYQVPLRLENR